MERKSMKICNDCKARYPAMQANCPNCFFEDMAENGKILNKEQLKVILEEEIFKYVSFFVCENCSIFYNTPNYIPNKYYYCINETCQKKLEFVFDPKMMLNCEYAGRLIALPKKIRTLHLTRTQRYQRTEKLYNKKIENKSTNKVNFLSRNNIKDFARAYFHKANKYCDFKQYKKAKKCLHKAIELDNKFPKAHLNRGIIYAKLKKYKKAESDFNKAIKLDASLAKAYYNRAMLYYDKKKYYKAQEDILKAIELDPKLMKKAAKFIDDLYHLGMKELERSYLDEAISLYSLYVSINKFLQSIVDEESESTLHLLEVSAHYSLACAYSLKYEKNNDETTISLAIRHLQQCVKLGSYNWQYFQDNKYFAPIASDPRFQKIIYKMKEDMIIDEVW